MTYYTISCRMTGQKPKTALGTDSTHTTWDWRGYITSLWSGSQSPMPLLWYQPECWITACRLRAATPAWLKSGRFLHLDEQSLSFFSCQSSGWCSLWPGFLQGCVSIFESSFICCWKRDKWAWWKTDCPLDNVQASCTGGTLQLLGRDTKEIYKGAALMYTFESTKKKAVPQLFFLLQLWLSWPECLAHVTVTLIKVSLLQIQRVWHAVAST